MESSTVPLSYRSVAATATAAAAAGWNKDIEEQEQEDEEKKDKDPMSHLCQELSPPRVLPTATSIHSSSTISFVQIQQEQQKEEEERLLLKQQQQQQQQQKQPLELRRADEANDPDLNDDEALLDYAIGLSLLQSQPQPQQEEEEEEDVAAMIERAIREADANEEMRIKEEETRNFQLAVQWLHQQQQQEEKEEQQERANRGRQRQKEHHHQHHQGNVRVMSRAEQLQLQLQQFNRPRGASSPYDANTSTYDHDDGDADEQDDMEFNPVSPGFRMNSNHSKTRNGHAWTWTRNSTSQHFVVGPNQQVRTKHDLILNGQANAHRLGLDVDVDLDVDIDFSNADSAATAEKDSDDHDHHGRNYKSSRMPQVGNTAINAFLHAQCRRDYKKGVATRGTGRAGGQSDAATQGGAMDAHVRILIAKAINQGYIRQCNGVVKEGKEAVVYHADQGSESGGYDVAIKVFKRIQGQDFKNRGDYVEGDPRYAKAQFRRVHAREQLHVWTEKEFRNLVRATRAGVPVASPLYYKDNVLLMRFIGTDGWPTPQLREIRIQHGSSKWTMLYRQVMDAVRKLYQSASLVHGDLSEYNILVAPADLVENQSISNHSSSSSISNNNRSSGGGGDVKDPLPPLLQAVLIDFGQAVDKRHPNALMLLQQDLDRIHSFFAKHVVERGVGAARGGEKGGERAGIVESSVLLTAKEALAFVVVEVESVPPIHEHFVDERTGD